MLQKKVHKTLFMFGILKSSGETGESEMVVKAFFYRGSGVLESYLMHLSLCTHFYVGVI